MEHYDWNEGWLFAPTFDPALVRPECPELSLTPVRLPHTVKPLPYNYCSENDYQRLCGYRREFFAPKEWLGRTVLLTGAMNFASEFDVCCIGLPGTIDNDLYGTDNTIGYDTTMNTIVECVDRIRDTAQSHERIFFIEVMGRDAGFLAQNSAIASGAEAAIIPEDSTDVDQLAQFMERGIRKSKKSCIVIVSESPKCGALYYADRVRKEFPEFDVRVSILGHLQRGGRPSARDRILASRTGCGAIEAIMQGQRNVMIGVRNNEVVYVPLSEAIRSDKPFDRKLIKVLDELSI